MGSAGERSMKVAPGDGPIDDAPWMGSLGGGTTEGVTWRGLP
jgi:hypothetical protein